jgi:hypothetical protein
MEIPRLTLLGFLGVRLRMVNKYPKKRRSIDDENIRFRNESSGFIAHFYAYLRIQLCCNDDSHEPLDCDFSNIQSLHPYHLGIVTFIRQFIY